MAIEIKTVRPFHCGTQYADFNDVNCVQCAKGADPDRLTDPLACDIEQALLEAYVGDGVVSEEIARRLGYERGSARYNWRCGEFVAKPAAPGA